MPLASRRTVYYLALVVATTLGFSVTYNVGMAVWENDPQPFVNSLEVVVQSFTTTGYGEDAPWQSPQMNLLVIAMQFAGIGLILTAADVFAVPWLRDALQPEAPQAVEDLADHVVICEHTPRTDSFVTELEARDREYVIVEPDAETAASLHEDGYRVIHGDPETGDALANADIGAAMAVVADGADDRNASIALAALDVCPDARVITLVEDASLARYHRAAGAETVLSPRQLLGRSLASQVPTAVTTDVGEGVTVGEDLQLVEVTVGADSDLAGQTYDDASLRERFGVNVIGAWIGGDFETPVRPDDVLSGDTRLLVTGETGQIADLEAATSAAVSEYPSRDVVLAGYGDSGRAAAEALSGVGTPLTVLDVADADGVDVVGDARDPEGLSAAGVERSQALILTVSDDTTAIFATLIARELNPDLYVVVRANQEVDVQKLYRAGADYVQSLATISGRMLASTVFEDEEVLAYERRVRIVRLSPGDLAGHTVVDERVRSRTGCTVLAVVHDGETRTDFDPATYTVAPGDELVVAGTDEAITDFERAFGV